MRQSLSDYLATGAEMARPYHLALLAEAYGKAEQIDEGLSVLAEALDAVHNDGGYWLEAEMSRLKGELLLAQEGKGEKAKGKSEKASEAEACFCQALDIARRQQAKSLELRATISLSHLWQQQGKQKEARQILTEISSWFTEEFETADLKEARVLLEELS